MYMVNTSPALNKSKLCRLCMARCVWYHFAHFNWL